MKRDSGKTDSAAVLDSLLLAAHSRMTSGADAYHSLDPSEIAMRLEEFDPREHAVSEKWALRNEVFSGFVEYCFADGAAPCDVQRRIEGFIHSFHPELAEKIPGEREWIAPDAVAKILRKHQAKLSAVAAAQVTRASLSVWYAELEKEIDFESVREMLVELVKLMLSQGRTWRKITAVAYILAKTFRPALIAGMSLEDIALLSGDEGRATASHRAKRIFTDRVAAAGFKGNHVHFQKSAESIEKYRAAQKGNSNRRRSARKKETKKNDPRTTADTLRKRVA